MNDPLVFMRSIVLIGFMCTGKSVVGRRLARDLHFQFVDTDRVIEEKIGKTISEIFSEEGGEVRFRLLEAEVVREVVKRDRCVVSTGGGVALNQTNLDILSQYGTVVWLKASSNLILKRAQRKPGKRPLLLGEDPLLSITSLLKDRAPFYQQAAFSVDTSDLGLEEVVLQVKKGVVAVEACSNPS